MRMCVWCVCVCVCVCDTMNEYEKIEECCLSGGLLREAEAAR